MLPRSVIYFACLIWAAFFTADVSAWKSQLKIVSDMAIRADWISKQILPKSTAEAGHFRYVKVFNCTDMSQPVVYIHIWKSGGTWTTKYLKQLFNECDPIVYLDPSLIPDNELKYIKTLPVFTVVRDPVQRYWSGYHEICSRAEERRGEQAPNIYETVETDPTDPHMFAQSLFFSDFLQPDFVAFMDSIELDLLLFLKQVGAVSMSYQPRPNEIRDPKQMIHGSEYYGSSDKYGATEPVKEKLLPQVLEKVGHDYCYLMIPIPEAYKELNVLHCPLTKFELDFGEVIVDDVLQLLQFQRISSTTFGILESNEAIQEAIAARGKHRGSKHQGNAHHRD